MNTKTITKRELALQWWNILSNDKQIEYYYEYKKGKENIYISHHTSLTGREVQTIWTNRLCLEAYGKTIGETSQEDINFITEPKNHISKLI